MKGVYFIFQRMLYLRGKRQSIMTIEETTLKEIEEALLSASDYIKDNIDAICDDDYMEESEAVLARVNAALDLIRNAINNGK